MDVLKRVSELIPFLEPYPNWVKALVSVWAFLTTALLLSLVLAQQQKQRSQVVILGRVITASGTPVSAASIELTLSAAPTRTLTDSEGHFRVVTKGEALGVPGWIRIAASGYRTYERVVQPRSDAPDLGVFTLATDSTGSADKPVDPAVQVELRERALLVPPQDILDKYSAELKLENFGVVKLLSERAVEANRAILRTRGEGTYFSFVRRTHEYGYGSDVALRNGQLSVGFAGLDFGHLLNVGSISKEQFLEIAEQPPTWLPTSKHEAWRFMWDHRPPTVTKEVRQAQRESRDRTIGGVPVSSRAAAVPNTSFLLRSISYNTSDVLVAIRLERLAEDGSLVFVWRILKVLDTPVATGPEPENR